MKENKQNKRKMRRKAKHGKRPRGNENIKRENEQEKREEKTMNNGEDEERTRGRK